MPTCRDSEEIDVGAMQLGLFLNDYEPVNEDLELLELKR